MPWRILIELEELHTRRNLRRHVSDRPALQYLTWKESIPTTSRSSGCPNILITADTYSRVIEGMDGSLANAMNDAL